MTAPLERYALCPTDARSSCPPFSCGFKLGVGVRQGQHSQSHSINTNNKSSNTVQLLLRTRQHSPHLMRLDHWMERLEGNLFPNTVPLNSANAAAVRPGRFATKLRLDLAGVWVGMGSRAMGLCELSLSTLCVSVALSDPSDMMTHSSSSGHSGAASSPLSTSTGESTMMRWRAGVRGGLAQDAGGAMTSGPGTEGGDEGAATAGGLPTITIGDGAPWQL